MTGQIQITVKCPLCHQLIMSDIVLIDQLPAIELEAKVGQQHGRIYLSQIYGSYLKVFEGVEDIVGSVAVFSCPRCQQPLPVIRQCDCQAPQVGMQLEVGGMIKICSRNGCKKHSLEFEDVNDAFMLLMKSDHTGLG